MEQLLVWIALAAGGVGLAVPLFRGRTAGGASPPARSLVGGVLAVIGAAGLLSLLTQPPFSPGQTLAPGLALGAITVLVAALALSGSSSPVLVWSGRFGVVTCGVALLTALLSARVLDALVGFAVGAVVTALLLRVEAGQTADRTAAAETTAVLGVTLAAATYLATFHRSPTGVREWQALPVLFSGASSLLLAVRGSLPVPAGREGWYSVLVPLAPLGVIAWLVSQQLHGSAGFLRVVLVGFGVFALLAWIERTSGRAAEDGGAAGAGEGLAGPSLLTALLVLGGAVLAFRELHGYGLALMVLAG
ncbi:MAG: hypothetical protein K0Q72_4765, partial [Armatimonadetes bacterium]|nr:hypothetical protein [Armatimonadota bacterium]